MTAEHQRLAVNANKAVPLVEWGPYLSERQWGTVREDYSSNGDAWHYLPFDQSHYRVYRWGEDGLAGISDFFQNLCFSVPALVACPPIRCSQARERSSVLGAPCWITANAWKSGPGPAHFGHAAWLLESDDLMRDTDTPPWHNETDDADGRGEHAPGAGAPGHPVQPGSSCARQQG